MYNFNGYLNYDIYDAYYYNHGV